MKTVWVTEVGVVLWGGEITLAIPRMEVPLAG